MIWEVTTMPEVLDQPLLNLGDASQAKAEGAFVAFAAGDALGWPQELRGNARMARRQVPVSAEFRRWTRRDGGRFQPHEIVIEPGEYSDDTQLTLAIARCRLIGGTGWWHAWTRTELPLWTLYQRGGGSATRQAAASWMKGSAPWKNRDLKARSRYFESGGNGVAMRVLPHAVFHARSSQVTNLVRDVVLDGVATHGHPRALIGATTYAYAAWWLLGLHRPLGFGQLVDVLLDHSSSWGAFPEKEPSRNGWLDTANSTTHGEYENLWRTVTQEMITLLEEVRRGVQQGALADDGKILEKLGGFGDQKGAGTVTAAAAIYLCARYAAQPTQGVLRAAFASGADTDTLAAMTGGLMGCLAGTDWLPREWFKVQDYQYLRHLAARLSSGQPNEGETPAISRALGPNDLDRIHQILAANRSEGLDLNGVLQAHPVGVSTPKSLSNSVKARTWKLKTSEGQTLFVTRIERQSKPLLSQAGSPTEQPRAMKSAGSVRLKTIVAGVKISVVNLKTASDFYEKVFGLTAVQQSSRYVSYGALSLLDLVYASELLGNRSIAGTHSEKEVEGSPLARSRSFIVLHVNDLQEVYRRVESVGGTIVQAMRCMPSGEHVFYCLDPEGNSIEVIEQLS
jgi:ADP-ribosylglycohydrolase/predicted enzyme related to lactoylglutathione lyase